MNLPKYDGTIHPDDWMRQIKARYFLHHNKYSYRTALDVAKSLVESSINVEGVGSTEHLLTALKNSVLFKIFLKSNKQKLRDLRYDFNICGEENESTIEFLYKFKSLCHNAEITDINEQKKYLVRTLNIQYRNDFSEKIKDIINTIDELLISFQNFIIDQKCYIRNNYLVLIKHVATGMYLCLNSGYVTLSNNQSDPSCRWKVINKSNHSINNEIIYGDTIELANQNTNYLSSKEGTRSPATNHQRVYQGRCGYNSHWRVQFGNSENYDGTWKLNDKFTLLHVSTNMLLRSHDFQFNIGDKAFQEVLCHNERYSGNDEWCIEDILDILESVELENE